MTNLTRPPAVRPRRHVFPSWVRSWSQDTGVLLLSQVAVTALTSGLSIVLARSLDTHEFGTFSGFLGLSQALSLAVDVGLAAWLLRELSSVWATQPPVEAEGYMSDLLRGATRANAQLGLALLVCTALVDALVGLSTVLTALSLSLMAYVVLIAISTALEAGLRSRRRVRLVVVTNVSEKCVLVGGVAVAVLSHHGLAGIALAYPIAGLVRATLAFRLAVTRERGSRADRRFSVLALLRSSSPFAVNSLAVTFIPRIDVPLIALISVTSAGYYALGYQIFTTLIILPVIAGSTLYPFAARQAMSVRRIALLFGVVGIFTAGAAILLAPTLIPAIFGARYSAAVGVSQVLFLALPLVFFGNGLLVTAYSVGREHQVFVRTLPGALAGSAAVVAGQELFGPVGAATGFGLRYVWFVLALMSITWWLPAPSTS